MSRLFDAAKNAQTVVLILPTEKSVHTHLSRGALRFDEARLFVTE